MSYPHPSRTSSFQHENFDLDTQSVKLDVILHHNISQVNMFCESRMYVFEETN